MTTYQTPEMVNQVIDKVTDNDGKIVVTTTISLDKSALEQRVGRADVFSDIPGLLPMQRLVQAGNISLVQIGPKLYLGLVNHSRTRAHTLCIADTLFIFVPRNNSMTGMAELIAEMVSQMPEDSVWQGSDSTPDIEEISRLLGTPTNTDAGRGKSE